MPGPEGRHGRGREAAREPARLEALLGELGACADSVEVRGVEPVGSDALFTHHVLKALPEPLRFTGLTPRMRALTLWGFHGAAAAIAVIVFRWASPGVLETFANAAERVVVAVESKWLRQTVEMVDGAEGAWWAVLTVLSVGVIAFWATWPHTRAT